MKRKQAVGYEDLRKMITLQMGFFNYMWSTLRLSEIQVEKRKQVSFYKNIFIPIKFTICQNVSNVYM